MDRTLYIYSRLAAGMQKSKKTYLDRNLMKNGKNLTRT